MGIGMHRYEEDEIAEQQGGADLDLGSDEAHVLYLVAYCGRWSGDAMHYANDEEDKERAKQALRDKHTAEHQGCTKELSSFGYI